MIAGFLFIAELSFPDIVLFGAAEEPLKLPKFDQLTVIVDAHELELQARVASQNDRMGMCLRVAGQEVHASAVVE